LGEQPVSFITDIVKYGLGQFGIEATGDTPSAIASSAITSFLNQRVNSAIKKSNPAVTGSPTTETVERNVTVELKADTNASIPVVYGEGFVEPKLVDAQITNNNCTMWYAVALSEVTGSDISGTPSQITFEEIYWNGKKLTFSYDGVTVAAAWEGIGASAKSDTSLSGNVKIYCYNNGSESPCNVRPQGLEVLHGNAYEVMPLWTSNHQMSNLVFAIIRVDYDAENEVTSIGNLKFKLRNSLKKPGDVIYDFMNNTVYGAGIPQDTVSTVNLNTYSTGTITFTDNRSADVVFTIPVPSNQTATITSESSPITRPYDIDEIIDSATTDIHYTIDLSNLPGSSLDWDELFSYELQEGDTNKLLGTDPRITGSRNSNIYTLEGGGADEITQYEWDLIKDPNIVIPDTLQGTYTYDVAINYTTSTGPETYTWQVTVDIPVAKLSSTVSLNAQATIS
jgi:hypothetical protein